MTAPDNDTLLLLIHRALAAIPEAADNRDTWIKFGRVIHGISCGSERGFVIWDVWSQNSPKYDPDVSGRTWVSFDITVADIFAAADAAEPDWRYPDIAASVDLPPTVWVERFVAEQLALVRRASTSKAPRKEGC